MFPHHHLPYKLDKSPRPDRRPLPRASEIRLRVKYARTREDQTREEA
jgi:hypothetical protein